MLLTAGTLRARHTILEKRPIHLHQVNLNAYILLNQDTSTKYLSKISKVLLL